MLFRERQRLRNQLNGKSLDLGNDGFALVLGKRKIGKSIWAVDNALAMSDRHTVIVDPTRRLKPAYLRVRGLNVLAISVKRYSQIGSLLRRSKAVVIVQPRRDQDIEFLVQVALRFGDMDLYLDEAHRLCSHDNITPSMSELIKYGRHAGERGVSLLLIARRPMELSPDARENADWIVAFKLTEPIDLQWLRAKTTKEKAEAVRRLPNHKPLICEV